MIAGQRIHNNPVLRDQFALIKKESTLSASRCPSVVKKTKLPNEPILKIHKSLTINKKCVKTIFHIAKSKPKSVSSKQPHGVLVSWWLIRLPEILKPSQGYPRLPKPLPRGGAWAVPKAFGFAPHLNPFAPICGYLHL